MVGSTKIIMYPVLICSNYGVKPVDPFVGELKLRGLRMGEISKLISKFKPLEN